MGGAIANAGGTVAVTATIVAESSSGGNCSGGITDDGYNIDDDTTCDLASPSISDSPTLDAKLGALANNGGPTETIALLSGSPALKKVPQADCPATDQRGSSRKVPCDIGSYDAFGNPKIKSFTPTKAKVGQLVTIVGSKLSNAVSVSFNGTPAVILTDSKSEVTADVPAGATSGPISVTTSTGGTVTSTTHFKVK
jgi:hypothetical protein